MDYTPREIIAAVLKREGSTADPQQVEDTLRANIGPLMGQPIATLALEALVAIKLVEAGKGEPSRA